MATKNPKAGRGSCPSCSSSVIFRRSPTTGKLSYTCDECDSSGYADQGGQADAKWSASIATPAPAPAPSADPPALPGGPPVPPAPSKRPAAFDLSKL